MATLDKTLNQTEVMGTDRELNTFDRVIKIEGIAGTRMMCVYDSNTEVTIGDLLHAMYANAQYTCNAGMDNPYKKLGFSYAGKKIYDRSTLISDIPNIIPNPTLKLIIEWVKHFPPDIKLRDATNAKLTKLQKKYEEEHGKKSTDCIFAKTLTGKCITFPYFPDLLVEDYKILIHEKEGIHPDEQRLIYAGKQLDASLPVSSYGMTREATIHLVQRLRGGMFREVSGRNGKYKPIDNIVFALDISNFEGELPELE